MALHFLLCLLRFCARTIPREVIITVLQKRLWLEYGWPSCTKTICIVRITYDDDLCWCIDRLQMRRSLIFSWPPLMKFLSHIISIQAMYCCSNTATVWLIKLVHCIDQTRFWWNNTMIADGCCGSLQVTHAPSSSPNGDTTSSVSAYE